MLPLTREIIGRIAPRPSGKSGEVYDAYVDALVSDEAASLMHKYGVTTWGHLTHFLPQIMHESGGFTILVESGAYSADRILAIFGAGHSAKISAAEARRIASLKGDDRAKALFERAYGIPNPRMAMQLGNIDPGDGYKFRGRSLLQTTGRGSYAKVGDKLDLPLVDDPDLLLDPIVGLKAALWEWNEKGCSRWAAEDNINMVTRRINGGLNGIDDRRHYLARAKTVLGSVRRWNEALPYAESEPEAEPDAKPVAMVTVTSAPAAISSTISATAASATPAASPTSLRPGDKGPLVEALQKRLKELGDYPYTIDGEFSDRTIEAVLAMKHRNGLPLSDAVDDATWTALKTAKPRILGDRATLDAKTLEEKGSTEIKDAKFWERIGRWATGIFGVSATAEKAGVGAQMREVDGNLQAGQTLITTVISIAGKLIGLIGNHLVPVVAVGLGIGLIVYARKNIWRRVELARKGLHLGH